MWDLWGEFMHPAHSAMVNEMESRFGWPQDERDSDGLILMRLNRMVIRPGWGKIANRFYHEILQD